MLNRGTQASNMTVNWTQFRRPGQSRARSAWRMTVAISASAVLPTVKRLFPHRSQQSLLDVDGGGSILFNGGDLLLRGVDTYHAKAGRREGGCHRQTHTPEAHNTDPCAVIFDAINEYARLTLNLLPRLRPFAALSAVTSL
jgi:hypothetical protein